jgi:hypothetical protein
VVPPSSQQEGAEADDSIGTTRPPVAPIAEADLVIWFG